MWTLFHESELEIPGRFNLHNALLALQAAIDLGAAVDPAVAGICSFQGLPHRLETKGMVQGVRFVDNAVSSIAESTISALDVLNAELCGEAGIHLVLGGQPKASDLEPYVQELPRRARSLHLFGQVADQLGRQLARRTQGKQRWTVSSRVQDALSQAFTAARPGDILCFSPGFASHDQYANFEERALDALDWWQRLGTRDREEESVPNP